MRRPRPTLTEMDSLQRRYDAVVATMNRVVEERDTARAFCNAYEKTSDTYMRNMLLMRDQRDALSEDFTKYQDKIRTMGWWDRLWRRVPE